MQTLKDLAKYLLTPLLLLFAYIFHLKTQNESLKGEVAQGKTEEALRDIITQKDEAGKNAQTLEDDYNRMRAEYDKSKQPSD